MTVPGHVSPAHDDRWRRLGLALACSIPPIFGLSWVAFRAMSGSGSHALWAAGILTFAVSASVVLVARAAWAPRLTRRRQLNVILVSWALSPALAAALLAAAVGVSAGWAAVLGVAVGGVASGCYARLRGRVTGLQTVFPLLAGTPAEAELLRAATQQPSDDPKVPASQRAMQRLNHARALTVLAMRNDDQDRLMEALPLLRAVVQDQTLDPSVALLAGHDLIDAESLLAERGRDGGRYAEAVDLYAQLVQENPGIPAGRATLHVARAEYRQYQMRAASEDLNAAESVGDQTAAARATEQLRTAYRAVERELTAALELTDCQAGIRVQCLTMLGAHLCLSFQLLGERRSDEGVHLCRQALRLRAGRTREQRPLTELLLVPCLLMRWDQRGDDHDLDEAERLLRRLARRGGPLETRARALLLEVTVRRQNPRG